MTNSDHTTYFRITQPWPMMRFTPLVNSFPLKAGMFVTVNHFHPSLKFVGKAGAYQSEPLAGLHYMGRLLVLPRTLKLGLTCLPRTNTLPYYEHS